MVLSSDEDEFASNFNNTTTPFRTIPVTNTTRLKPNGRPVAGPSTKPVTNAKSRQKRARSPEEIFEDEIDLQTDHGTVVESDVNAVEPAALVAPLGKGGRKKAIARPAPTVAANAKVKAVADKGKGKGKVKAEPPPRKVPGNSAVVEVMDVDDDEQVDETEQEPPPRAKPQPTQPVKMRQPPGEVGGRSEGALRRHLERVEQQLRDVTIQRQSLIDQLDEAFQIRRTEEEEARELQANQYEARLKSQEEMIQELTSQLARVDALTHAGKTSTLHFLTREAADEERRAIEKEVQRLTNAIEERDLTIASKDAKILEQEETIKTLQSDLKAEIENTKAITARSNVMRDPPSSANRGRKLPGVAVTTSNDPKNGLVVSMYEDLTNLLVINVKQEQSGPHNDDEIAFNCIYTHADSQHSLCFVLKRYTTTDNSDPSGELVEKIMYTPLELDKESDDFVTGLDFLSGPFTFPRVQLNVFLKTINDRMGEIFTKTEVEENEEE